MNSASSKWLRQLVAIAILVLISGIIRSAGLTWDGIIPQNSFTK